MIARVRAKLSYANLMSTLAVFIALGGSAYAATKITGADVENGSLTGRDIKNSSLTSRDIKDNAIKSKDIDKNFIATLQDAIAAAAGDPSPNLWAAVHSNGQLSRSNGVTGVRTLSPGSYEVVFSQAVTGCGYFANVGDVEARNPTVGYAVVSPSEADPNTVHVQTKNGDGSSNGDRDFYVAVLC